MYLENGIIGSGSSRMYSFNSDATVWTSVELKEKRTAQYRVLFHTDNGLAYCCG